MAGTYLIKMGIDTHTNWLWAIIDNKSYLIGWDYHLKAHQTKGIEIYSINEFIGAGPFNKKGYEVADDTLAMEILDQVKIKFPNTQGLSLAA